MLRIIAILSCLFLFFGQPVISQKKDSTQIKMSGIFRKSDSTEPYSPRRAIIRSAIIPGWGQATNKKYWKIPIVYGALGTTAYIFFNNIGQYNDAKKAYANAIDGDPSNDYLIPQPYFSVKDQPERIRVFRNQVRQNIDYTVLFFVLFWGLNVADAAVDANLKTFDVSDDLSLHLKAGYSELAKTNGISFVLSFDKFHSRK